MASKLEFCAQSEVQPVSGVDKDISRHTNLRILTFTSSQEAPAECVPPHFEDVSNNEEGIGSMK